MLALDRVHQGPGRILAKAEFLQPGGSVKDRAALAAIQAARHDGHLAPGAPVVEMTSGNMGAGLAVVCAALGHPLIVTMSAGNSPARAAMLRGLGAEVVLVDQVDGKPGQVTGQDIDAAAQVAAQIAHERDGFYVDQFHARSSIDAHEIGTGREILQQTGGRVDGWVAAVGTGASFQGVARALKAHDPTIHCAAVEPAGSEPLSGRGITNPRHLLQGTGYGLVPPHWDAALMDSALTVTDAQAQEWRDALARREGLYVGYSAAANVCAASQLASELKDDPTIVTLLCDTGLKY